MKPIDQNVSLESEFFIHTPSESSKDIFLYPLFIGRSVYTAGYVLRRSSFDSYFIMYVISGEVILENADGNHAVPEGSFILLDCYKPHAFRVPNGADTLWCHYDGPTARGLHEAVVSRLGSVFRVESNEDSLQFLQNMSELYRLFSKNEIRREAHLSKLLNDLLHGLLLYDPPENHTTAQALHIQKCMVYMASHYQDDLTNEELARIAMVSPYHFIRIFKRHTGCTPHEYILNLRMASARTLLRNTDLPIKEICFKSGFQSVSVFCVAFKNHEGMTPGEYRKKIFDTTETLPDFVE